MRDFLWRCSYWLMALAVLLVAGYFIYTGLLVRYGPRVATIDPRLPQFFRLTEPIFWAWFFGCSALAIGGAIGIPLQVRAWRSIAPPAQDDDPTYDATWAEITAQLMLNSATPAYVVLAPSEAAVTSLLAAARLTPTAVAPAESSEALLRGFQTESGVIFWCGGRPSQTTTYLARALGRLGPASPPLCGIVVLLPFDALRGTRGGELATTYRSAMRALAAGLDVRCPLVLIVSGMQEETGFLDFVARMPSDFANTSRFGFSVAEHPEGPSRAISAAFDHFTRSFERKVPELMAEKPLDQEGNVRLLVFRGRMRQAVPRLRALLETLASLEDDDPMDLVGCYLVADGSSYETQACAAATLLGRVVGDPDSARWSRVAQAVDRQRRRQALALTLGGLLAIVLLWTYTISAFGLASRVSQAMLAGTVLGWLAVLVIWVRRKGLSNLSG